MKIQKIFKHGAYNAKTNDNDIALIKLKTPVKIARDVKPACLPKTVLVPGTKCFLLQRRYGLSYVSFYKCITRWLRKQYLELPRPTDVHLGSVNGELISKFFSIVNLKMHGRYLSFWYWCFQSRYITRNTLAGNYSATG